MKNKIQLIKIITAAIMTIPVFLLLFGVSSFTDDDRVFSNELDHSLNIDGIIKLQGLPDSLFVYAQTFGALGFRGYNGSVFYILNPITNRVEKIELDRVGLKRAIKCLGIQSLLKIETSHYVNKKHACFDGEKIVVIVNNKVIATLPISNIDRRWIPNSFRKCSDVQFLKKE